VLDHGSKCELLRTIKTNKTREFETALTKARGMRRKYLGLRPGKANGGFDNLSASVWKATAAIAT